MFEKLLGRFRRKKPVEEPVQVSEHYTVIPKRQLEMLEQLTEKEETERMEKRLKAYLDAGWIEGYITIGDEFSSGEPLLRRLFRVVLWNPKTRPIRAEVQYFNVNELRHKVNPWVRAVHFINLQLAQEVERVRKMAKVEIVKPSHVVPKEDWTFCIRCDKETESNIRQSLFQCLADEETCLMCGKVKKTIKRTKTRRKSK